MKLILLGLPGAGKGTVGKQLATLLSVPHISIGDRVRDLAQEVSPIGERLRQAFSASSGWTPLADDLAVQIAKSSVKDLSGWILDGFPRNAAQAENAPWLCADAVILLAVSETVARSRVLGRGRQDDGAEKFERRMATERERLPDLLKHLRSRFQLVQVDADPPEEIVLASLRKILEGGGQ